MASSTQTVPAIPAVIDPAQKPAVDPSIFEAIIQALPRILYKMSFKKSHRVQEAFIVAPDYTLAQKYAVEYCEAYRLTFISVWSAITDVHRRP